MDLGKRDIVDVAVKFSTEYVSAQYFIQPIVFVKFETKYVF